MTAYTVRDAKIEDAQRILEIYAYYVENTAITFEYDVPSKEEFKQRMRKTMQKYPYLVIEKREGYTDMPMQDHLRSVRRMTGRVNCLFM